MAVSCPTPSHEGPAERLYVDDTATKEIKVSRVLCPKVLIKDTELNLL